MPDDVAAIHAIQSVLLLADLRAHRGARHAREIRGAAPGSGRRHALGAPASGGAARDLRHSSVGAGTGTPGVWSRADCLDASVGIRHLRLAHAGPPLLLCPEA